MNNWNSQPGPYGAAPYPSYPQGAAMPGQAPYPVQPQGQPGYPYPAGQHSYAPQPGYPQAHAPGYPSVYPSTQLPPTSGPGYPSAYGAYPSQAPYPAAPGGFPVPAPYPAAAPGYPSASAGYPAQAPYTGYPPVSAGYPAQVPYPNISSGYPAQVAYPATAAVPSAPYLPGQGVPTPAFSAGSVTVTYPQDEPTIRPYARFDVEADCKGLHKAMKGLGSDEKAIIEILTNRSLAQRLQMMVAYKTMYGKDLINHLKSELSGNLENTVIAMLQPPEVYDAHSLHDAVARIGTVESALIEIIFSRTNAELFAIKTAYKFLFKENLENAIKDDTSGYFRRILVACLTGARQEGNVVDVARAQADARTLYEAGVARWGTDEAAFISVFALRSLAHLKVVFDEYKKIAHQDIEASIKSEMSGSLEEAFLAIARIVKNKHTFFAQRLYDSMAGAGTRDKQLIRVVVTRSEKDLGSIKREFLRMYGKTLESYISGDCSGDYKKILLAIVNYGSR